MKIYLYKVYVVNSLPKEFQRVTSHGSWVCGITESGLSVLLGCKKIFVHAWDQAWSGIMKVARLETSIHQY